MPLCFNGLFGDGCIGMNARTITVPVLVFLATVWIAGPVFADWRQSVRALRIAVVAGDNASAAVQRAMPLALYLERTLRIGVDVVPFRSLKAVGDAQAGGRVDIAAYSATGFAATNASCQCLEAVAVPKAEDGNAFFYAIAVTRREDGVESLTDLQGRVVAMGPQSATAARIVPAAVIATDGKGLSDFFAETTEYTDHVAALSALMAGDLDAVFTWSSLIGDLQSGYSRGPLRRAVRQGVVNMADIDVAWQSVPIPHGPVTIRAGLPDDLKATLRTLILNLYDDDPDAYFAIETWYGYGFEPPDMPLYDGFADLLGYKPPPADAEGPGDATDTGSN